MGPVARGYHQGMTGREVWRVRERLGLTQREFARRLGVHKVTVATWEANMRSPREPAGTLIWLPAKTATRRGPKPPASGRYKGRRHT